MVDLILENWMILKNSVLNGIFLNIYMHALRIIFSKKYSKINQLESRNTKIKIILEWNHLTIYAEVKKPRGKPTRH